MSVSTQASPCFVSRRIIEQCVEFAGEHGLRDFPSDRRTLQRVPLVHPVRYCLDSVPCEAQAHLGYAFNPVQPVIKMRFPSTAIAPLRWEMFWAVISNFTYVTYQNQPFGSRFKEQAGLDRCQYRYSSGQSLLKSSGSNFSG